MISNDAFGLPGGERSERPQFGDACLGRAAGAITHHGRRFSYRETVEMIFAHIEREPLPARRFDHQNRLARTDVFTDLCGDDGDNAVSRSAQDHLVKPALKHGDRGGGSLHLRVGDRALLPGRTRHRRIVIRLGLRDVGAGAGNVVLGLVERLLGLKALACQRAGSRELGLYVVEMGACLGDCCGPGNLHLINGLFDCQRNGVPVLAIAAHIPSSEIGIDYFQATHPESLFRDCSHYVELVSNPRQLPQILKRAIRVAIAKRGVSVVVLPGDVALMKIDADVPEWIAPTAPVLRPSGSDIGHLADFLNKASRATLFCGAGCAGAHAEVIELARKLKAPIVHAFRGKEFVEYDNPYDVGMTGLVGFASCYAAMKNCDALLLLGTNSA